jgi:hypothetical protein
MRENSQISAKMGKEHTVMKMANFTLEALEITG